MRTGVVRRFGARGGEEEEEEAEAGGEALDVGGDRLDRVQAGQLVSARAAQDVPGPRGLGAAGSGQPAGGSRRRLPMWRREVCAASAKWP
ncbi:hypothetical protein [Actinacidiphila sp. bgisy144]|uniref:hypothetical protein n=1 Tax=Actinacidiphila sp. bgisy144 TaxID=3413791 RepID=UPI003EB71D14